MSNEQAVKDFFKGISEKKRVYFVGTTTNDAIGYSVGEEIVFKIRTRSDEGYVNVPLISYMLEGDDGKRSSGFCEPARDGWFYIRTSIDCAGFVHLVAAACDEGKNEIVGIDKFEGGAGADVESIMCGSETPDGYLEFWARLKAEVGENEPEIIYEKEFDPYSDPKYPVANRVEGYVFYDMHIKVKGDMYASCVAAYPRDAEKGSLKLIMNYRGYGIGPTIVRAFPGAMTVSVSAHSIPNFEPEEYYDNLSKTTLRGYGFNEKENEDPDTTYWKGMMMRDMQALRYFKDHELLNKKDYIFVGGSQAGMQAANMAAHSGLATECVLMLPWMADIGGYWNCGRNICAWHHKNQKGVYYFDTAVAAGHIKCPTTIVAGLGDYICPPSGVMATYNNLNVPKRLVLFQNMTHPYRPAEYIPYKLGEYSNDELYKTVSAAADKFVIYAEK